MNKKKGFTLLELLGVIIILAVIAIIATPIVLNVIEDTKKSAGRSEANIILNSINSYCEQEKLKEQGDKNYVNKCNDGITKEELGSIINLGNLDSNKIEVEYNKDKIINLKVESNGYNYELNNGKMELVPKNKLTLVERLLKTYDNNGSLIKENNIYYYKGNNVNNNYVSFGGYTWRILKFDENSKTIEMITNDIVKEMKLSNVIWNNEITYNSSDINFYLINEFYNKLDKNIKNYILQNEYKIIIPEEEIKQMAKFTPEVEQKPAPDIGPNLVLTTVKQDVGLLDQQMFNKTGGNNSYLKMNKSWWLGNVSDKTNGKCVSTDGLVYKANPTETHGIRPVIKIANLNVLKGNGTINNPYQLDIKKDEGGTKPENIQSTGPTIVYEKNNSNEDVINVYDYDNKLINTELANNLIFVKPNDNKYPNNEIRDRVEMAYNEILESNSLHEVCPKIPNILKERGIDIPIENYIASELFYIGTSQKQEDLLNLSEGNYLKIVMDGISKVDKNTLVIVQTIDGQWIPLGIDELIIDNQNKMILKLMTTGVVAVLNAN